MVFGPVTIFGNFRSANIRPPPPAHILHENCSIVLESSLRVECWEKEKFSNLMMCLWGEEGAAEIGSPKLCHLRLRLKLVKGLLSS